MKIKNAVVAGVLAVGVCSAHWAQAEVITYEYWKTADLVASWQIGQDGVRFDVPTFNSSLGTLDSLFILGAAYIAGGSILASCTNSGEGCWTNPAIVSIPFALNVNGQHLASGSLISDVDFSSLPRQESNNWVPTGDYQIPIPSSGGQGIVGFIDVSQLPVGGSGLSFPALITGFGYGVDIPGLESFQGVGLQSLFVESYLRVEYDYTPTPIPEPETYAMMLAGLGLLGLARRRKQQG